MVTQHVRHCGVEGPSIIQLNVGVLDHATTPHSVAHAKPANQVWLELADPWVHYGRSAPGALTDITTRPATRTQFPGFKPLQTWAPCRVVCAHVHSHASCGARGPRVWSTRPSKMLSVDLTQTSIARAAPGFYSSKPPEAEWPHRNTPCWDA